MGVLPGLAVRAGWFLLDRAMRLGRDRASYSTPCSPPPPAIKQLRLDSLLHLHNNLKRLFEAADNTRRMATTVKEGRKTQHTRGTKDRLVFVHRTRMGVWPRFCAQRISPLPQQPRQSLSAPRTAPCLACAHLGKYIRSRRPWCNHFSPPPRLLPDTPSPFLAIFTSPRAAPGFFPRLRPPPLPLLHSPSTFARMRLNPHIPVLVFLLANTAPADAGLFARSSESFVRAVNRVHHRAAKRSTGLAKDLRRAFSGMLYEQELVSTSPQKVYCVSGSSLTNGSGSNGTSDSSSSSSPSGTSSARSSGTAQHSSTASSPAATSTGSTSSSPWKVFKSYVRAHLALRNFQADCLVISKGTRSSTAGTSSLLVTPHTVTWTLSTVTRR